MPKVQQLINAARRRLRLPFVFDYPADYRNSVYLAGTARSGTTWVSDVINHENEYRYIFEPFYPKQLPLVEPFGTRRYLRPHDGNAELLRIAEHVVSGRVRSRWTERFNRRLIAHKRLIKCIRSNLMLGWLHHHFPAMPMILLLRHPCAVADSYVRQCWSGSVGPLLAQEPLLQDFLGPFEGDMRRAQTAFERVVFIWCIETLVPLKQFSPGEIHVVFYEQLITEPEQEIRRLFDFLGKSYGTAILEKLARPSLTARKDSAVFAGRSLVAGWKSRVDPAVQERSMEIVRGFGLEALYSEELMPNMSAVDELMGDGGATLKVH